ncbi:MAG: hypothetical protein Q9179_004033 [Wetmoreana sp. 5 TL-2023]
MVARLLLPPTHETMSLGGRSSAVALFDLGNTFSLLRLKDVMVKYTHSCNHERLERPVPEALITIVRDAMAHLHRETVRKFQYGMSAEEAAREAEQRREAVEKSTFSARLDWSESEAWREDTRNAIKTMGNDTYFAFKITKDGVDFNVDD